MKHERRDFPKPLDYLLLAIMALCMVAYFFIARSASAQPTFTVTVRWTPPTTNTDNTPLTNLSGYRVYYGTSAAQVTAKTNRVDVSGGASTQHVLTQNQLQPNTLYFFGATAVNANGVESALSNIAQRATPSTSVPGVPASVTVEITFNAGP